MSEPVGIIFGVPPEIEHGTSQEKEAYLRRLTANGVARGETPPPVHPPYADAASDPVASGSLSERVVSYTLPDGREVWVRPLSLKDRILAAKRIRAELRKENLLRTNVPAEQWAAYEDDLSIELAGREQVWRTILCTYKGPEKGATRHFEFADAQALLTAPDWAGVVSDISDLSQSLTQQGIEEAAALKGLLSAFFGRSLDWQQECSRRLEMAQAALSETSPETLRARLLIQDVKEAWADYAFSVSSLKPLERPWGKDDLTNLALVLGMVPIEQVEAQIQAELGRMHAPPLGIEE
jgi:hypothetical protein